MDPPCRAVIDAIAEGRARDATLAVVVATAGSTYVRAGAMALFGGAAGQVGWLSGGCLESDIARAAQDAAQRGAVGWLEIDTRDDEDLFAPSATGCRGQLRLALLPLRGLPDLPALVAQWREGLTALRLEISRDGHVVIGLGLRNAHYRLGAACADVDAEPMQATLCFDPLPRVLVFGAGPETAGLVPALRALGWRCLLVERRARWAAQLAAADRSLSAAAHEVLADPEAAAARAALVMHHHFEFDREALEALADSAVPYVGLLGPPRRRDDLLRLLAPARHAALQPRLRAPLGLQLGGHGPEAIALSIAAQLQAFRHGR